MTRFSLQFQDFIYSTQMSSSYYVLSICPDCHVPLKEIHVDQIIVLIQPYSVY